MSDDGKRQQDEALTQFLAEVASAKQAANAAKDGAVAEIETIRLATVASKATFDSAATEFVQAKSAVDAIKATAIADIEKASTAVAAAKASADAATADFSQAKANVDSVKATAIADIEKAISSVTSAKATADAATAEIDKLKTAIATAKGAIDADQKNSSADAAVISGAKKDVEKLKAEALIQSDGLAQQHATITGRITDLEKNIKPLEGLLSSLTEIKADSEAERSSVTSAIASIGKSKAEFETLAAQAQEKHNELSSEYGALDEKISDIEGAYKDIAELKKLLLEDDGDNTSIRTSINALKDQIVGVLKETSEQRDSAQKAFDEYREKTERENLEFVKSVTAEFGTLHKKLEGEIRALLPSAGAAGLATTYYDAKSRYAWTSFAGRRGSETLDDLGTFKSIIFRLRSTFGYNPTNLFSTGFFYALFILPIIGIVYIFLPVVHSLPNASLDKYEISLVVVRFLISLPLAAISAFGVVSLNLYRRLYEEYNFKQRVMELYSSFQKEVAEGGTDEQKKALLQVMIDAVSDRSYLAKGNIEGKNNSNMPGQLEILSQLNAISNIVSNIAKAKV